MDNIVKSFEKDIGALRGIIKSSGYETDPYKIIILVERYILEYGTKIIKKTVEVLLNNKCSIEDRQKILLEVLQTQKPLQQLHIYNYKNKGFI